MNLTMFDTTANPKARIIDLGSDPVVGEGIPVAEEVMFGATPSPLAFGTRDTMIRNVALTDQMRFYPLRRQNREYLYELSNIVGHVASDSQNPYVWQSRGVLAYEVTGKNSKLIPSFGLINDTAQNVQLNAVATSGILDV